MKADAIVKQKRRYMATPRATLDAGSVGWCWQTVSLMATYFETSSARFDDIQALWDELVAERAWEVVPDGDPYGTPEAMLKGELGITLPQFRTELSRREQVFSAAKATAGEVLPPGTNRHTLDAQIAHLTQGARGGAQGVSRRTQQTLDKLARERPDLLAEVQAENMSVHAAATRAGFVRQYTPLEKAKRAAGKLDATDRKALIDWLVELADR